MHRHAGYQYATATPTKQYSGTSSAFSASANPNKDWTKTSDLADLNVLPSASKMPQSSTPFRRGEHIEIISRSMLPFRHVDRFGIGMSAVVDIVEDKTTGQKFAHKAFRQYYGAEPEKFKQAFKNEIDIIKRLHSHLHIIQIHWSYACGNELGMLLTPAARDGDLRAYLRRIQDAGEPPTSEQHSVLSRSFGCLASGLAFIHSHKIRHKDIKPQNILVHDGHMIYTDFGIAFDATEQDTTTTGRPEAFTDRYRAPEVANWEPRNRKSDVFSLGCVFIEIMALLSPDAKSRASDPRPYWHWVDDLQNTLIHLGASNSKLSQLFLVFLDMLKPGSADRLDAEVLLHRMRSIQDSHSDLAYKLFCKNCEGSDISTPQNTMEEGEITASSGEDEELHENLFTGKEDRLSNGPAFTPYQDRVSIQAAIRALIRKPLLRKERPGQYIYILWRLHNPDFIKISYTMDVPRRLKQWEKDCKHRVQEYKQQSTGKRVLIANAPRVERLVETELRNLRFEENHCGGCHNAHSEWYRTTSEHAAKVIKKYSDWMAKDPYQLHQTDNLWGLDVAAWSNDIKRLCQLVPFDSS